jgi:hypothetical protein
VQLAVRKAVKAIRTLDLDGGLVPDTRDGVGEDAPDILLWQSAADST